jgi:hypothetical protein
MVVVRTWRFSRGRVVRVPCTGLARTTRPAVGSSPVGRLAVEVVVFDDVEDESRELLAAAETSRNGTFAPATARTPSLAPTRPNIRVLKMPGAMAITRMPCAVSSSR